MFTGMEQKSSLGKLWQIELLKPADHQLYEIVLQPVWENGWNFNPNWQINYELTWRDVYVYLNLIYFGLTLYGINFICMWFMSAE